ncbi:hypothetical protein D1007_34324 [Hordeum vulgare]|nr:hypothetical protein D1007_34324 [Hordeum vulgare]
MTAAPSYTTDAYQNLPTSLAFDPMHRGAIKPDDDQRHLGQHRHRRGVHRVPPPPPKAFTGRACGSALRGAEYAPTPREGEVVVFGEHFARGFGLPTSTFFHRFLRYFSLQLHHLGANAILQLAAFVSLCEGYLGIETCLDLYDRLFFFKQLTVLNKSTKQKELTACGAALVYHRT